MRISDWSSDVCSSDLMDVVGRNADTYQRPAIIIANHTSILDTPTVGLLHPMQVFMMNDRQLNSPFFGRAMRMVGAHPASGNQPEDIEKLRTKINQGYSVIVFPRSEERRVGEGWVSQARSRLYEAN